MVVGVVVVVLCNKKRTFLPEDTRGVALCMHVCVCVKKYGRRKVQIGALHYKTGRVLGAQLMSIWQHSMNVLRMRIPQAFARRRVAKTSER